MRRVLLLTLALYGAVVMSANMPRKKLAGPPEDFGIHVLPDPDEGTISSNSAMVGIDLAGPDVSQVGAEYTWRTQLPADGEMLMITFMSPIEGLILSITDPANQMVPLHELAQATTYPLDSISVPATSYIINNPLIGMYSILVTGSDDVVRSSGRPSLATEDPDAFIIWYNDNELVLNTQLNTYSLSAGSSVGLVTYISDAPQNIASAALFKNSVASAEMTITFPNGSEVYQRMIDDGLHSDGEPDDGIFGAVFIPPHSGSYTLQSTLYGKTLDGRVFVRTTQHLVPVVHDQAEYTGAATGTWAADTITVQLHITSPLDSTYKAYAEVWGVATDGSGDVPVCWIGGVVDTVGADGAQNVQLEIDVNWLVLAGAASTPLSLRNVRLQDLPTSVPVSLHEIIPITVAPSHAASISQALLTTPRPTVITEKMRVGARPALFDRAVKRNTSALVGQTVFLHGYCAQQNPWQASGFPFDDSFYFLNPSASVSHDEFANLVDTYAKANSIQSYSLVAHSQGGPVSVHLGNYYWSGLDIPEPTGRLIQSVGSPYEGCSGAGSAAGIGKVFGVACGANHDLTIDGSKLWLAGISMYYREKTYYYTTTYLRDQFFGDYCNLPVNAVLKHPNDGTTELVHASLAGARNMGNTQQWCHTPNMKYKAQCSDAVRNAEINANAAR